MGKKRRSRLESNFSRKKPTRNSKERVLIVCEGAKTEPFYLKSIKFDLRMTNADVRICGEECGSDPMSIYNFSLSEFYMDGDYDIVFCVFDRDTHDNYVETVNIINNTNLVDGKIIQSIKSVPCFEYWVLLHYIYTTRPFSSSGKRSGCDNVIAEVKKYLPGYEKADRKIYEQLKDRTDEATSNAKKANSAARSTGTDNPTTEIYKLVSYLKSISL